jgi:methyl-accepting chemotaxis protein
MDKKDKSSEYVHRSYRLSVGRKIFLVTMLPFIAVMILLSAFSVQNKIESENGLVLNRIETYVRLLENGDLSYESASQKEGLEEMFSERVLVARLVKRDGTLAYETGGSGTLTESEMQEYISQSMEGYVITFSSEGRLTKTLVSFQPIVVNNRVVATLYLELFFDETNMRINEYTTLILIIDALSIIFLYVMIMFLTNRMILSKIRALTVASSEIMKGKLDLDIDVRSNDEIGELSETFRKMVSDLNKSQKEIKKYTQKLEGMVKARTEELEKSKQELERRNVDLERFNKLAVGRELKMVEMKKKLNAFEAKRKKGAK